MESVDKNYIVTMKVSGQIYKFRYAGKYETTGESFTKAQAADWILRNWIADITEKAGACVTPRETIDGAYVIMSFDVFRTALWEVSDDVPAEEKGQQTENLPN